MHLSFGKEHRDDSIPDIYLSLHSFRAKVSFLNTDSNTVLQLILELIKRLNGSDSFVHKLTLYDVQMGSPNAKCAIVKMIKASPFGFRDKIVVSLYPLKETDVCAAITSRCIAQNVYTALCNCSPYVAWVFCCCGLIPTSDHGENKRFILELLELINIPFVHLEEGREATSDVPPNAIDYFSGSSTDTGTAVHDVSNSKERESLIELVLDNNSKELL